MGRKERLGTMDKHAVCNECHGYGRWMEHNKYCNRSPWSDDCGGRLNMRVRCNKCDGTGRVQ